MRYGGRGPRPRMEFGEAHGVHRSHKGLVSTSSTGYTSHERPTSSRAPRQPRPTQAASVVCERPCVTAERSALLLRLCWFDEDEDDRNIRKFPSFSRSSSISSSICSCLSCAIQPTEWRKRPSKLLQGYRIEEYYRFDAILGKYKNSISTFEKSSSLLFTTFFFDKQSSWPLNRYSKCNETWFIFRNLQARKYEFMGRSEKSVGICGSLFFIMPKCSKLFVWKTSFATLLNTGLCKSFVRICQVALHEFQ